MINSAFILHLQQKLYDQLAISLEVNSFQRVGGGDINAAFKMSASSKNYFVKVNYKKEYPGLFEAEVIGLKLLKDKSSFVVPSFILQGDFEDKTYLILEHLNLERQGDWDQFGSNLAQQHFNSTKQFGLNSSNYIGSLLQSNRFHDQWDAFFLEERLLPLFKMGYDEGLFSSADLLKCHSLGEELSSIFPKEEPALLHGDLWSGNAAFVSSAPCIFDPAVYYGHREMDIAMMHLFGGFPKSCFQSYNEIHPLEIGWESRIDVCNLYPLLVHAILFRGSYIYQVKDLIKRF